MNEFLTVDGLRVELQRNKRRRTRIAVTIDPAGHVVLDAPTHTQSSDAVALVHEHARWLRHRVNEVEQQMDGRGPVGYRPGEVALYLGQALQLTVWSGTSVVQESGMLKVPDNGESDLRERVRQWYSEQADQVLGDVIAKYDHLPWLDAGPPRWRHRFMKSQWGSCSAKGVISLNTHLIKLSPSLIDYVVLHELCHLKHHDHSRRFHALVSMYMPDWSERSRLLRKSIGVLLDV